MRHQSIIAQSATPLPTPPEPMVNWGFLFGAIGCVVAIASVSSQLINWFTKKKEEDSEVKAAIKALDASLENRFSQLQTDIDTKLLLARKDTDHSFELLKTKINTYFDADTATSRRMDRTLGEVAAIAQQNQQNISDLCLVLREKHDIDFTPSNRQLRSRRDV